MAAPSFPISVVVPIGPGETAWHGLIACLTESMPDAEIVLSAAAPPEAGALDERLRWIHGTRGRAVQLNRGVAAASGELIWLLHADSRPDATALDAARRFAVEIPHDAIGWFDLAFDRDGPRLSALNALGANLRSRLADLPFGDQGWILQRSLFDRIGGFDPEFGRGEDLEFIVRARARGARPIRIGARLATSARRYRDRGWLATTLAHAANTLRMVRAARKRLEESAR